MESIHKIQLLCLSTVIAVLLSPTSTHASCPTGCSCEPVDTLSCTGVDTIPEYFARQDIVNLSIDNHNITELTSDALEGFDNLKTLDLSDGTMEKIDSDAFDVIKETITSINLDRNILAELPVGLVKDMPKLRKLNLTRNHLQILKEGSLVNLGELIALAIELNNLTTIESGALSGVPKLDNINLFDNKLTAIPVDGLKGAKNCRKLDLSFNRIATIPEDLGGQLESLEDLDLESNPVVSMTVFPEISTTLKLLNLQFINIRSIASNAWIKLPKLEELYLSGNLFEELKAEMFVGLQNVNKIYLMSLPRLKKVGPNTFSNMTKLGSLHLTFNSMLTEIDDSAFSSTRPSYVHLRENKLSTFSEKMLNWTTLKYVSLDRNPVICDCKLTWMFKPEYKPIKSNFSDIVCAQPSKYAQKKLMSLDHADLYCGMSHEHRLATGLTVAVFCLILMTVCIVLFRCRKNISSRCRRYFMYQRYQNDLVFTVENDTAIGELDDGDTRPLKELRLDTD